MEKSDSDRARRQRVTVMGEGPQLLWGESQTSKKSVKRAYCWKVGPLAGVQATLWSLRNGEPGSASLKLKMKITCTAFDGLS